MLEKRQSGSGSTVQTGEHRPSAYILAWFYSARSRRVHRLVHIWPSSFRSLRTPLYPYSNLSPFSSSASPVGHAYSSSRCCLFLILTFCVYLSVLVLTLLQFCICFRLRLVSFTPFHSYSRLLTRFVSIRNVYHHSAIDCTFTVSLHHRLRLARHRHHRPHRRLTVTITIALTVALAFTIIVTLAITFTIFTGTIANAVFVTFTVTVTVVVATAILSVDPSYIVSG
ncbi:hypothetical protein H4582DRAFT_846385 [Lactarius indigo]|nr:hypothetical protein H4582DRAFT_846385 [Lactarius indigo]